jgi:hypothetical protein
LMRGRGHGLVLRGGGTPPPGGVGHGANNSPFL